MLNYAYLSQLQLRKKSYSWAPEGLSQLRNKISLAELRYTQEELVLSFQVVRG